jgi:FkbM family methyltransferase
MGRSLSYSFRNFFRRTRKERDYRIGRHTLTLPPGHKLDCFQKRYLRYDVAISEIARFVTEKYPEATAIDIGANIGDTAAAMRKFVDIPILCIEGNENFLPYLKKNIARLGPGVSVEEAFVGRSELSVGSNQVDTQNGTASINPEKKDCNSNDAQGLKDLADILNANRVFSSPKLVKIDTDGYDFAIICHAKNILKRLKPILFFEYYLTGNPNEEVEEIEAINSLFEIGYGRHLIYDNFGNFLIAVDSRERFEELNSFLRSNLFNGVATYYLDVCSFCKSDEDLFWRIREYELKTTPRIRVAC